MEYFLFSVFTTADVLTIEKMNGLKNKDNT